MVKEKRKKDELKVRAVSASITKGTPVTAPDEKCMDLIFWVADAHILPARRLRLRRGSRIWWDGGI